MRNVLSNYTDMYASMVHLRILLQNYRNIRLEQSDGHKLLSTTTASAQLKGPETD